VRVTTFVVRALLIVLASALALTAVEGLAGTRDPGFPALAYVFESFSAFGTVGLSLGVTSALSVPGKIVLILTMFSGRVFLILLAMRPQERARRAAVDYPDEEVLVG
jgi:trk system potassium uptake protein TrkH